MAKLKHTEKPASQKKRGPGSGSGQNPAAGSGPGSGPRHTSTGGISKPSERHRRQNTGNRAVDAAMVANLVAKKAVPQLKHRTYIEIVDNEDKKEKKLDIEVTFKSEPPAGFEFVPIGNPELTALCKDISREKEAMIFVVSNSKAHQNELSVHMNRIGHHVRQSIVEEARQRLGQKGAAVATDELPKTQQEINIQADAALRDLFPRIPNTDRQEIIDHAFRLGATFHGEPVVGLQIDLSLSRRVQLAVLAHIRHNHTRYDELLKETSWMKARKAVEKPCLDLLVKWRGDEENGRDDLDEILREVVIISDDEDEGPDTEDEDEVELVPSPLRVTAATAPSTRLTTVSRTQTLRPVTPPAVGSLRTNSAGLTSPGFVMLPNPPLGRSPREIVHSTRPVPRGNITGHRYMRYRDAWRSAVNRNRANAVARPGDSAVEVVYSVPPPPLPTGSSVAAAAPAANTATSPYTGPGVLISGPAAAPARRDWTEATAHVTGAGNIRSRDGLRSPVTILQPRPMRIAQATLTNHMPANIPVEDDPQKLKDLLIPSIEGSPKQATRGPIFVRPVNNINNNSNSNGKRGRDSGDSEGSPRRRNPDSVIGDTGDGSPRSKRRRITEPQGAYDAAPTRSVGHYSGGYRASRVPQETPTAYSPSRMYSETEKYRNQPAGPHQAKDQRGPSYREPVVIGRPYGSSYGSGAGPRESSAISTGHVTFHTAGPIYDMPPVVARSDIMRPVAPQPGMHDNGQWFNPHTPLPTVESRGYSAYQMPPPRRGPTHLPPTPVSVVANARHRSPQEILSYASARAAPLRPQSNQTFFVRRVDPTDEVVMYAGPPGDGNRYSSYRSGFYNAARQGLHRTPQAAPPQGSASKPPPSDYVPSRQTNPIVLD